MSTPRELKEEILKIVKEELGGVSEVAFAIFPNHWNVGDSALWWATCILLHDMNISIRYVCNHETYDADTLNNTLSGDGVILLCGGGNLGDKYPDEQGLRERILINHKDKRVIQLPQSIWFTSVDEELRVAKIFESHPNFTLFTRDQKSYSRARDLFGSRTTIKLCPDMAFYLYGSIPFSKEGIYTTILKRDDQEVDIKTATIAKRSSNLRVYDWHQEDRGYKKKWSTGGRTAYYITQLWIRHKLKFSPLVVWATERLSKERTLAGLHIIDNSKAVISDRLHGCILSILIDQPTYIINNSYGKNKALYETWLTENNTIHFTNDFNSAIEDI